MIGTYEYPCKTAKEVEFALKGRKNCEKKRVDRHFKEKQNFCSTNI